MSDYIPHELVIEILIRLPVESLVRFTIVCKSWYKLITNPIFINSHLNHAISSDNRTLLVRVYDSNERLENYTLRRDDETFAENFSQLQFPFRSPIGYFRVVGSCNGLICLSNDLYGDMESIILWNPAIRKSATLQVRNKPRLPHMFVLGFGVCPVTNDHKVVKIVYLKELAHGYIVPPEVEVYSLSTGSWRDASASAPRCCMVEFCWSQAFVLGAVHWIGCEKRVEGGCRNLIVTFDMDDETFCQLMLPDNLADGFVLNLSVAVHGNSLATLNYNKEVGQESCCVWLMKEYGVVESWTRLFTVNIPGMLQRTVGFRNNGEALLSLNNNELVAYDPNGRHIRDLGIQGSIRSFFVDTYVESLALLKGQSSIREGPLDPFEARTGANAFEAQQ